MQVIENDICKAYCTEPFYLTGTNNNICKSCLNPVAGVCPCQN